MLHIIEDFFLVLYLFLYSSRFVALKLPHLKKSDNLFVREGVAYVYITSESVHSNWTLSALSVNDANSIMGNTLKPLYDGQVTLHQNGFLLKY